MSPTLRELVCAAVEAQTEQDIERTARSAAFFVLRGAFDGVPVFVPPCFQTHQAVLQSAHAVQFRRTFVPYANDTADLKGVLRGFGNVQRMDLSVGDAVTAHFDTTLSASSVVSAALVVPSRLWVLVTGSKNDVGAAPKMLAVPDSRGDIHMWNVSERPPREPTLARACSMLAGAPSDVEHVRALDVWALPAVCTKLYVDARWRVRELAVALKTMQCFKTRTFAICAFEKGGAVVLDSAAEIRAYNTVYLKFL